MLFFAPLLLQVWRILWLIPLPSMCLAIGCTVIRWQGVFQKIHTTLSKQVGHGAKLRKVKRRQDCPSPTPESSAASFPRQVSLQLFPFHLVNSTPFSEFMAHATPQWQVLNLNYFSQKTIPAPLQHVKCNVSVYLDYAVNGKVHITTDTWSSNHGQGCYISITVHWVNLDGW